MPASAAASLADAIEHELRAHATPERAAQEARYLKSELVHLGADAAAIKAAVRALVPKPPAHDALIALVEALWNGVFERRAVAVLLLDKGRKYLVAEARVIALPGGVELDDTITLDGTPQTLAIVLVPSARYDPESPPLPVNVTLALTWT